MLHSLLVKDYMRPDHLAFDPEMEVLDAIHQLLTHDLSGAPVVDRTGRFIGYLSEKDCLKIALSASYYHQPGGRVREFMHQPAITIDAEASLTTAAEYFLAHPHRCLPVCNGGRLAGQIFLRDVLSALEKVR